MVLHFAVTNGDAHCTSLCIMVKNQPINKSCFMTLSSTVRWKILMLRDTRMREKLHLIGDKETLHTQVHWRILAPHSLLTYLQFLKNLLFPFPRLQMMTHYKL